MLTSCLPWWPTSPKHGTICIVPFFSRSCHRMVRSTWEKQVPTAQCYCCPLISVFLKFLSSSNETLLPCKNNYHHTEQVFPQICFEKRWSTGYSHPEMALVWSHATPGPRFPVFCSCCSLSVPHPLSDLFVFILQDFTLPRPSPNQTESICPRVLHRPLDYQLLKDKGTSYSSCPQVLAQCLQCATQLRNAWWIKNWFSFTMKIFILGMTYVKLQNEFGFEFKSVIT